MSAIRIIDPATAAWLAEQADLDRRVRAKMTPPEGPIFAGRCQACPNELEDSSRGANRGYASGLELGLCGGCAAWVNTPEAMEAAERDGADLGTDSRTDRPGGITFGRQALAANAEKQKRALQ